MSEVQCSSPSMCPFTSHQPLLGYASNRRPHRRKSECEVVSVQKPDALAFMGEFGSKATSSPLSTRPSVSARSPHCRLIDLLSVLSICNRHDHSGAGSHYLARIEA